MRTEMPQISQASKLDVFDRTTMSLPNDFSSSISRDSNNMGLARGERCHRNDLLHASLNTTRQTRQARPLRG